MNLDQSSRGKSKGLELIYAPIQTSSMTMDNPNFSKPIFVSYTQHEGDIYIKMNLENYHLSALLKLWLLMV